MCAAHARETRENFATNSRICCLEFFARKNYSWYQIKRRAYAYSFWPRQDPPLRLIRPLRLGRKKLQNIITVLLPSNILIQPDTHESLQQQRLDF